MEKNTSAFAPRLDFTGLHQTVEDYKKEMGRAIIGQENFIELLFVALLSDGHVLIEGVPGIAKTAAAKMFARTLNTAFSRIQFTPDLMPSDVLGTSVFNLKTAEFEYKKGPIFSNIVLIDEINRSPAKTQAALFEVMEEQQITSDGYRHVLPPPFMVVATQNPIEQEGTYALPEAQLDRFLFRIKLEYPSLDEEVKIIEAHHQMDMAPRLEQAKPVIEVDALKSYRENVQKVVVESRLMKYIAMLIDKTRSHPYLYLGASPRASIAILKTAKARAAISNRDFVTPEDIQKSLNPVLNHRLILSPEREMEGVTAENVVEMITKSVEVPR